jgi:uncharacterized delta-60 repeat protein
MTALVTAAPAAGDSMVVQPDGKILMLGDTWPQAGAIARLEPDGALDQSFGSGGFALDYRLPSLQALALQSDGRIVATATSGVQLARYLADGSPDLSFAGDGIGGSWEPDPSNYTYANLGPAAITTLAGGSIVVAEIQDPPDGDAEVWIKRYDADGASLETIGHIPAPGPASSVHISDLLPQSDGSLVGAGSKYEVSPTELRSSALLARFLPGSGSDFDPSFGGGAGLVFPVSEDRSQTFVGFRALTPDGDGLVAGGSVRRTFLVARFARDGALDQGFGEGGVAALPIHGPAESAELAQSWAEDIAALPGGRIVLAGGTLEWGEYIPHKFGYSCATCPQSLLAVVDGSGNLDPSFGEGGLLRLSKPDGSVFVSSIDQVAGLSDGRIIAKGTVPGPASMEAPFVARLNPDGSYDPTFGEGGLTMLRFPCTDQSHAERQRAGCVARLRAKVALRGLRQRRPALSLRARPSLDWAAVGDLTLTLPKSVRLSRGFRSKLRVRGAGDGVKVSVTRPRSGKPYTVIGFSKLGLPRQLRVRFEPGALHLRVRLPRRGLTLKLRAHFLDSRWGSWAGHDEIARRAG